MKSRIILVIMLNLLYQDQAIAGLRVIFDRIEPMEVSKESKIQIVSMHIVPHNNSFFQAEFNMIQDLDNSKLKIAVRVYRCLVGEAPDTCEYLINLKPPNVCMFFNAENTAWNTITDAFTPKLRCPLKKGKYVADNITFDANKWTMFPLDNWHFKLTFKLFEGDVFSTGIIVETHYVRVH